MPQPDGRLATAHLDSEPAPYAERIRVGRHVLTSDEPAALGGGDTGPAPYQLLLSALAACTGITLRMYAAKKGWDLGPLHIDLVMLRDNGEERIERTIRLAATVTAEQRARLAEIADKTPVTRTLLRGTKIATTLA